MTIWTHAAIVLVSSTVAVAEETPFAEQVVSVQAGVAESVVAVDVDGDGDMDIVSDEMAWYENLGSSPGRTPDFETHLLTEPKSAAVGDIAAADLDADGDIDLIAVWFGSGGRTRWFENDGQRPPGFTEHLLGVGGRRAVFPVDLDSDMNTDFVAATNDTILWYRNDGSQPPGFDVQTIAFANTRAISAADLDGDGDEDVLSTVAWYENDGEPEPSFTTRPLVYIPEHPESVYAVDLDGDGDLDILVANSWDDTILWFKNDGATPPSFVAQIVSDEAADVSAVFAMDMDGDADVDIVAATPDDDRILWFENDGRQAPIFIPHEVSSNAIEGSAVFAADIDGDGNVDVISASELDSKISWYEQGAEATPRAIPVPAEYPTIQLAINAALPVDEVVVAPGLYYETIDFLGKPITVRSSDGPLVTTIDAFKEDPFVCDQSEPVVRFMRSEDRDSVLSGFTLTEGFGVFDGGSCTTLGGGAFIKGSSPTIAGCIFLANRGRGGALYYDDASPHITNCYFEANLYDAIDGRTSDVTFSDCVFRYHLTTALARFDVNLTFERCRILSSFGPAVSGGSSVVSLVDCVIGDNITGITTHPALSLTISGTLFCGNTEADIEGKYTDGGGNQFLARCPPPQDVDLDGVVGFTDLLDVLGSWGLCIACPADTDFSGEVDFVDLLSVLAAWGG